MGKRTYRILNKTLRLSLENETIIPEVFANFQSSDRDADIVCLNDREAEEESCYGIRYLSADGKSIRNVFFSQKDRGQMLYTCADDYSQLRLRLDSGCTSEILSELLMVGFYSCMSLRGTLLLHASAICHEGKTVVFTAASGVGKTTQALLWKVHRGATIINGDKVFLSREDGKILAWGSPWCGSSPYAENMGAEAAAIVVLEQAEENTIRKLSGMEILEKLLPHVFFPNWDPRCESAVLDLLNEVLEKTEVYLLRCCPNEDAVALVEKTVFGT